MTSFSSPSYTTMPRNRVVCSQRTSVLRSAQCTCQCHFVWLLCVSFCSLMTDVLWLAGLQVSIDSFIMLMKNRIHSQFPLKCPLYEYSPNVERFTLPLVRCRTHPHQTSVGCPLGTLSGKRGLTQCELKRPSFGCLIFFDCDYSNQFTDSYFTGVVY